MKLVEAASKLLNGGKKQDKRQTPEEIAHEAFALVNAAGPIGQQAKAEYRRDFDLTQHQPGTVFRVEHRNGKGDVSYSWHAIGSSDRQNLQVFFPYEGFKFHDFDNNNFFLHLDPDFKAVKENVRESYFPTPGAGHALFGFEQHDESHYPIEVSGILIEVKDVYHTTRIDLIQAGHTVKEEAKEKTSGLAVLKPALERSRT